jgi:large subunit ribosomal protein L23
MRPDDIIVRPLLTEKSNGLRENQQYVFAVDPRSNKHQIRAAVVALFAVHPVDVNVLNVKGKPRRVRQKLGYTSAWKKAIVTLPEGEKIQIFEGA